MALKCVIKCDGTTADGKRTRLRHEWHAGSCNWCNRFLVDVYQNVKQAQAWTLPVAEAGIYFKVPYYTLPEGWVIVPSGQDIEGCKWWAFHGRSPVPHFFREMAQEVLDEINKHRGCLLEVKENAEAKQ